MPLVLVLLAAAVFASLAIGPVTVPLGDLATVLGRLLTGNAARDGGAAVVVLDIRLPRTILAVLIGAALAVSGAVMQGIFRNPLADPGVVGVSSGAALAAALWFVLGAGAVAAPAEGISQFGLPLSAFAGGLVVTLLLHLLSRHDGRTSVMTLILAGIAITARASAGTGLLVFMASDQQLRDFTFWTLGSLAGATWMKVALVLPFAGLGVLMAPTLARGLDALALGEAEAFHLGIEVERLKRFAIVGVAAAVGASVAVAGVIAFFGLAVPHLVRLAIGPAHRPLLAISAVFGAALLVVTDLIARTIASPAEMPLGVITAGMGAPFMLWLILARRRTLVG
jgi:iron complex transport system permease protein